MSTNQAKIIDQIKNEIIFLTIIPSVFQSIKNKSFTISVDFSKKYCYKKINFGY